MNIEKKVLIISYYWPPVGGSGVQRWLKMSRYLRDKGWEPVIYTPENPSFGNIDRSLLKEVPENIEVIKLPIWEPYQLFSRLKGKKGAITASDVRIKKNKNFLDKLFLWIRGNFFIPDPRIFWIKPSVKFLPDILKANNIKAIITTGPPHSLHLIGEKLKRKTGVYWIADFRDLWTEWDLYSEFSMMPFVKVLHKKLEKKVLQNADKVFTINNYYKEKFEALGERPVIVISNGYDEADFKIFSYKRNATFSIRHIGIVDEMRDPSPFITALKSFIKEHKNENIEVEFVGNVADTFKGEVKKDIIVSQLVYFSSYLPHPEIVKKYEHTEVLLLVLTKSEHAAGNIPGKIYEYLASGARILALGPEIGEVADILNTTGAGKIVDPKNIEKIKVVLDEFYQDYKRKTRIVGDNTEQFSRRAQAYKVAEELEKL